MKEKATTIKYVNNSIRRDKRTSSKHFVIDTCNNNNEIKNLYSSNYSILHFYCNNDTIREHDCIVYRE